MAMKNEPNITGGLGGGVKAVLVRVGMEFWLVKTVWEGVLGKCF